MEDRAEKLFGLQRVVFVSGQVRRKYFLHALDVTQHWLELGLDELVPVVIGRLPHDLVASLVLGIVGHRCRDDFGVPSTGGLAPVNFVNIVV